MPNANKLVTLYHTYDTFEANLIKSALDNENIPCMLNTNAYAWGYMLPLHPQLKAGTYVKVIGTQATMGTIVLSNHRTNPENVRMSGQSPITDYLPS